MARKKSFLTAINQAANAAARAQRAQERKKIAEQKRLERERVRREKQRIAEAKRLERERVAKEKKIAAEAKRLETERVKAEKKRIAEAKRLERERNAKEKKKLAEAKKLERKRAAQEKKRKTEAERIRKAQEREEKAQYVENNKLEAINRTIEAQKLLESMENIINHALSRDYTINFDSVKNTDEFTIPMPKKPPEPNEPIYQDIPPELNLNIERHKFSLTKPEKPPEPNEPIYQDIPPEPELIDEIYQSNYPKPEKPPEPEQLYWDIPPEPDPNDEKYIPKYGVFDFSKKREAIKRQVLEKFQKDMNAWEMEKLEIIQTNQQLKLEYEAESKEIEDKYQKMLKDWENQREEHLLELRVIWVREKKVISEANQQLKLEYEAESKEIEDKHQKMLKDWGNQLEAFLHEQKVNHERQKQEILQTNQQLKSEYEAELKVHEESYKKMLKSWENEKNDFLREQEILNESHSKLEENYYNGHPESIHHYSNQILSNSDYHETFPQEFELEYNPENKILIVEYQLPSLEDVPTLKEVKYIQTRDEFTEKTITQAQLNRLYDKILYQITLRTIHELYEAHENDLLEAIVFNGHVNSIDPATGQEINNCVLSVQANKDDFEEINLEMVEPKACFKKLKGVGSSKLHCLTAIPPVVKMKRDDSRFTESYDVIEGMEEGYNLAAMDWEDFEHLIRELFERAFAESGGEVKVTQASRDGGIDAVIFDPDPLRGGKIVVQAKRYTNVVGVSAVRDLYGTLVNEGANKGILVTTSDYGPDAYKFASDKPIQLLNGGNLLHLLEQYGYKARINLQEAKQTLSKEN